MAGANPGMLVLDQSLPAIFLNILEMDVGLVFGSPTESSHARL